MSALSKLFAIKGVKFEKDPPSVGSLYKQSISIAWPATVEGAMLSIIGSVDTMMVGSLGYAALAAVGLAGQPRMILTVLVQALCVGTTAITARRKGAQDRDGANECFRQSMIMVTILGILFGALGYLVAEPFLTLAGANEDTLGLSTAYFRIICLGFPLNCWLMAICAAMRGVGKTRITMTTNVTANLVNVFFNYCLINGNLGFPALGVEGAAIATVIGTFVATVIAFVFALKKGEYLQLRLRLGKRFHKETFKSLISVGSSSIAESVFLRIGFFVNSRLVAGLGTLPMAVYQVVSQVSGLSFTVGDGIAAAGTTLVGQNLGAKRKDLAAAHIQVSRGISYVTSGILMVLIFVFRRELALLFNTDPEVVNGATAGFLAVIVGMVPQNGRVVYSGCLRGAGDVKFVAFCSLISVAVFRPVMVWLMCYPLGEVLSVIQIAYTGPWIAFVLDAIIRDRLMFWRIKTGKWANIRL